MNDFEALLERLVPGTGHLGLSDDECPSFPTELGLEPLGVLARGSVGWLFRARDPLVDREVAVKVSRVDGGRRTAEQVLLEARTTARLEHSAVLAVHRVLDLGDRACAVYQLAPRLTLHRLVHGDLKHLIEAFPDHRRLAMCMQGAAALATAHELGVAHGDLHPGNIAVGDHGEPFVLDWGGVLPGATGFSGHPAYASPEQLRGHTASRPSDVYAIAAITWEVMSLRAFRPRRREESLGDWLGRLQRESGGAPAEAPEHLDPGVEALLRRCLDPDPEARPSAGELVVGVRAVLTGQDEARRRAEGARALVDRCREALEGYQDLADRLVSEQKVAAVQRTHVSGHEPVERKRTLWETEDRIRGYLVEQEVTWLTAVEDGLRALTLAPDAPLARQTLADLWWARFRQSEAGASPAEMAMALSRLQQFDDGRYLGVLAAPGKLTLDASVEGASVVVERFEPQGRRLVSRIVDTLALPLQRHPLPPGSYRLVVRAAGFADAVYPLALRRGEHHRARVVLYRPDQIGEAWVQVAAGSFHMGGDPLARLLGWRIGGRGPLRGFSPTGDPLARQALESCSPTLGDRFVMRTPVTSAEYLAFLEGLPAEEVEGRLPGEVGFQGIARPLWSLHEGRPVLPETWDARWPVVAVSQDDARAYAAWLSERQGRVVRLPTEEEWEKAARGVDGRPFPWGAGFDPTFAHMRTSQPGPAQPAPVGSYPVDTSVWGCQDMAGGVREWTTSAYGAGRVVVRGGSWRDDHDELRCAARWGLEATRRSSAIGFRLVSEQPLPT